MQQFTVGDIHEAIAETRPEAECLVFRDRKLTWSEVTDRTRRLANFLNDRGYGCHTERADLAQQESGQDHLAIYLHNGNEYLECMLGAFKGRVAPFNVNYRYVAEELIYLLNDSSASVIVYHSIFAPILESILPQVPLITMMLQVDDESGHNLLPGAMWYEDALLSSRSDPPAPASPDDLYILYTGGTTGMPKGVMWRQGDALVECFGGSRTAASVDDFLAETKGRRALVAPPFMHGAGHWVAFGSWNAGGTVFVPSIPERLDAHDIWSMVEQEKIDFLLIVGDAFARPLIDQLKLQSYDLSTLTVVISGGAALSAHYKDELLELVPHLMIIDGLGSSEAGGQLTHMSAAGGASTGTFPLAPNNHVLSSDYSEVLQPGHVDAGHPEAGWLAKSGRLALGYLGDAEKTAKTYPVINGVRYVVPGDRAVLTSDGLVEMRGRDSVTINSGGEKIFAEEVEMAVKSHPAVLDCVVTGRPSERWGNEVVAIVHLRAKTPTTHQELIEEAAKHIARYKLPKDFIYVDHIVRSPSGKADYRWAKSIANPA
ncbi:MAG: fatty-acid--CoA ligase [actinobacterium acAcidi]|nr:MAG: fatty-acid--CoA ligase [actinobacterium acAcidi]